MIAVGCVSSKTNNDLSQIISRLSLVRALSMASMQQGVEWLSAALAQLHDQQQDSPARRAAESALVSFRSQDSAWGVCLHILSTAPTTAADATNNNTHLLLFAAQTLRAKLNEQGSSLDTTHLEQLKQALLHRLLNPELTPLLRQLCLAVASLAALLPSWQAWLAPVCGSLPWRNAVQLLHDVAEEACSDWRHVAMPGELCACTLTADVLLACIDF